MSIVIKTPRGSITTVQTPAGAVTAQLEWNPGFGAEKTGHFNAAQRFVDSEVLRRGDKYVPFRTGVLRTSGVLGTVVGSGEVAYIAQYAARQYYRTAKTRSYDPLRGAYWFERMKTAEGAIILVGAQRIAGGRR